MSRIRNPKKTKEIQSKPMLDAWMEAHPQNTIVDFDKHIASLKYADAMILTKIGTIIEVNLLRRE